MLLAAIAATSLGRVTSPPPDPTPGEVGGPRVTAPASAGHPGRSTDLEPLDVDGVHTVAIGSVLWLVAFAAMLPFVQTLRDNGRLWWLWTCLTGFAFGMLGLVYCRRRRRAIRTQPGGSAPETSRFGAAG